MAKQMFEFTEKEAIDILVESLKGQITEGKHFISMHAIGLSRGKKGFKLVLYVEPVT